MATITGKTSAKIDELVNASVVTGSLSAGGALTLTTRGGTNIAAGSVATSVVSATIDGSGHLILTRRDGSTIDVGAIGRPLDSWPVNSIYISVSAANPDTVLGGGTWVRYAKGKVLVGVDEGDTDFDTVEEMGGVKNVTLTAAQSGLRDHGHTAWTDGQGSHTHQTNSAGGQGPQTSQHMKGDNTGVTTTRNLVQADGNHGHNVGVSTSGAYDATASHTNVQPYITVYMWKRTA